MALVRDGVTWGRLMFPDSAVVSAEIKCFFGEVVESLPVAATAPLAACQ